MSFYDDDTNVGEVTRHLVARGLSILQFHYLANDDRSHVRKLLELFDPPHGAIVLDAGCGVGAVAELMHELRPDLQFLMLNISAAQLAMCPAHFEQIHASFEKMPLHDASVGGVMFNYSLGHGDLERTIAEAERVLRPGGVLFIYDLSSNDPSPMERALEYTPHLARDVIRTALIAGLELKDNKTPSDTVTGDRLGIATDEQRNALTTAFPIYYRFVKR